MSGNTNFPAGFNPEDAQALVATMTAKLQKKVSESQTEIANTMGLMQVQSTKASYEQAFTQVMAGIDEALASAASAAGYLGAGFGYGKSMKDGAALNKEFMGEEGSLTNVNKALEENGNKLKGINGPGLQEDNDAASTQVDRPAAEAELKKQKDNLIRQKEGFQSDFDSRNKVIQDNALRLNMLSQGAGQLLQTSPQTGKATAQAEGTRASANSQAANAAEKSVSSLFDSDNTLIRDAQQASDTYVVSVAASRG